MFCKSRDRYFRARLYFIVSGEPRLFLFVWLVACFCMYSFHFPRPSPHGSRLLLELQPLPLHSHQQKDRRRKEGYDPSLPFSLMSLGPELRHMWSLFCIVSDVFYYCGKRGENPESLPQVYSSHLCWFHCWVSVTPQHFYQFCRQCWLEVCCVSVK